MKLAITGVPGTGKTTLAKEMAKLMGAKLVSANDEVEKIKGYKRVGGEKEVRLQKLQRHLKKIISASDGKNANLVLEGHILCEFGLPVDKVLVLRCNPVVLQKRLAKRKYNAKKLSDNVISEALDYCLIKSEENYGKAKVLELDNTKFVSAKKALSFFAGTGKTGAKKRSTVRWLALLPLALLKHNV